MGHRANLAIVRGRDWCHYYDHWAANSLDVELFWGPHIATQFIVSHEPIADRDDWLADHLSEGAAIIDHDRRVLLWYGGEDVLYNVFLREALTGLMHTQWTGWEIRWASGGIAEIGAYLAIRPELLRSYSDIDTGLPLQIDAGDPDWNNVLVTLKEGGRVAAVRCAGDAEQLSCGPRVVADFAALSLEPHLEWQGEPPQWGVHVDTDTKAVFHWNSEPCEHAEEWLKRAWSNWDVEWGRDRIETHLELARSAVQLHRRTRKAYQLQLLSHLRRNVHRARENPVSGIAAMLGAKLEWVDPATAETRSSAGDPGAKSSLLELLESRLLAGCDEGI